VPECALYDIIEMRACMFLNALYILVFNESLYVSECALYDIIKMRACMCLNDLYMVLIKGVLLCACMRFI
jgi:hypothetical protein